MTALGQRAWSCCNCRLRAKETRWEGEGSYRRSLRSHAVTASNPFSTTFAVCPVSSEVQVSRLT